MTDFEKRLECALVIALSQKNVAVNIGDLLFSCDFGDDNMSAGLDDGSIEPRAFASLLAAIVNGPKSLDELRTEASEVVKRVNSWLDNPR